MSNSHRPTISVAIITSNEEANLGRTLESVTWADEVVVVDSGSTDRTCEIARQFQAKVFVEPWKGFASQKNSAIQKCTGDWILSLDADEEAGKELAAEIQKTLPALSSDPSGQEPRVRGFLIPRKNYFLGRWIRHGGFYPDRKLRLFKRGSGRFLERAVHETAEVDGETARLTPLGMLIMREELVEGGIEVPLLPPPPEMTAVDLLTVVGGRGDEELSDLADRWLSSREPAAAATELLSAAAAASPAGRFYAVTILSKLPDVPWSTVLAEPALRPYARDALGEPREPADLAWLLLDALAASADAMGELDPEAVEVVSAEALPPGHEQDILADAWRLRHPMAYEVLTLIGTHHPDKQLAKTARTAAHKARSAT
ncbi:glycosyltransferase family 2 protein [Actinophytocola sp.]|uniref:glycosyltransferase family 2 protein n=1 Tax=Actinophytocola sp. TaxID=1872138 RepID=UPI003899F29E